MSAAPRVTVASPVGTAEGPTEELDHRVLTALPIGVVVHAGDGQIIRCNDAAERLLGLTESQMTGLTPMDPLWRAVHEDGSDFPGETHPAMVALLTGTPVVDVVMGVRTSEGTLTWISVSATPVLAGSTGSDSAVVATFADITGEVDRRRAAESGALMFGTAMEAAAIGMALADSDRRFTAVNRALCDLLGYDQAWFLAHRLSDIVHPDDREDVIAAGEAVLRGRPGSVVGEVRVLRSDGTTRWVRRMGALVDGGPGRDKVLMLQIEDVTTEHDAREQLAWNAIHDPLTGLKNRAWILEMLETDLAAANRDHRQVAVLFLDLDNFKVINDSLGHLVGDDVLATTARRIVKALRPGDRVGRFGGDEFIVIAPSIDQGSDVEGIAERLSCAVVDEVPVGDRSVVVSASIGIALSDPRSTPTQLLHDADAAMFRAKATGRAHWEFSDAGTDAHALSRLDVEAELRTAIAQRQFVVHYQPIVSLADGSVVSHEALVRWLHPSRGLLLPAEFLPVAEDTGLVLAIDDQVLEQVCEQIAGCPALLGPVSINESPVHIARSGWHDRLLDRLDDHGVDPSRIVLEVTETAILSVVERTRTDLADLRRRGIGIHVDDFGTGYSSIALLRDLPVTGLKLDMSFTRHITTDTKASALAAGLAGLVQGLGLDGIAEGIETADQADLLREQGWSHGQGYLYGRPAPQPARTASVR